LLVVELDHGFVDVLQCPVELATHRVPIARIGFLDDAIAARHDRFAHIDRLGEGENVPPDLLDPLAVLGLHRDKAVGNDRAEEQRDLGAVGAGRIGLLRSEFGTPVRVAQLVENGENLARHRNNHVIDGLGGKLAEIDGFGRFLGGGDAEAEEEDEKWAEDHDCGKFHLGSRQDKA